MKLILLFTLIASLAYADPYACIIASKAMSAQGKQTILRNIKTTGKDLGDVRNAPTWLLKSNTNVAVRVVCVRIDALGINNWKNITNAKIEKRLEVGLSESDKPKFDVITRANFIKFFQPQAVEVTP